MLHLFFKSEVAFPASRCRTSLQAPPKGRGPPAAWRRQGAPVPGAESGAGSGAVPARGAEGGLPGTRETKTDLEDPVNRLRTLCFPERTLPSQSYASPASTEPSSRGRTHSCRRPPRASCRGSSGPRPPRPAAPTTPASPAPPRPTPPPRARLPQPGRP